MTRFVDHADNQAWLLPIHANPRTYFSLAHTDLGVYRQGIDLQEGALGRFLEHADHSRNTR